MTKSIVPLASPPWTKLGRKLESMVRKAIFDFQLLEQCPKIGIALSGGKDSLTLLYLLKAISGKGFQPFEIVCFHVGGEYSCGAKISQSFLKAVCDALDVKVVFLNSTQKLETLECYRCSRERRSLIFEAAKREGISHIAFGHHRDDSVETLLLNLFHKGEFAANLPKVPMVDYGITIIRPLIYLSKDEIRSFAELYGFYRITCECPVGQTSKRKDIETILTQLESHFPNVKNNLAIAAHHYGSQKALKK
jgi:tRNA(Ile)-lysidine synthase TilS/MesJ